MGNGLDSLSRKREALLMQQHFEAELRDLGLRFEATMFGYYYFDESTRHA